MVHFDLQKVLQNLHKSVKSGPGARLGRVLVLNCPLGSIFNGFGVILDGFGVMFGSFGVDLGSNFEEFLVRACAFNYDLTRMFSMKKTHQFVENILICL